MDEQPTIHTSSRRVSLVNRVRNSKRRTVDGQSKNSRPTVDEPYTSSTRTAENQQMRTSTRTVDEEPSHTQTGHERHMNRTQAVLYTKKKRLTSTISRQLRQYQASHRSQTSQATPDNLRQAKRVKNKSSPGNQRPRGRARRAPRALGIAPSVRCGSRTTHFLRRVLGLRGPGKTAG